MRSLVHLALTGSVVAQHYKSPFPIHAGDIAALPPSITPAKRQISEPCTEVRELWLSQQAELNASDATPSMIRVPAQFAYDCLMSVPVDVEGDIKEITELKSYLEYQSTLAWLKNGVKGIREPLDIMGRLDKIADDVKNNAYKSDYEVQIDIRLLLDKAHDFHLQFWPDITQVFSFARPGAQVVSLSTDGTSLPKIYALSDLSTNDYTASPIEKINGQSAEFYLENFSADSIYHDVDARYNTIFPNPALQGLGADSGGLMYTYYIYPGSVTTFTLENGTETKFQNVAGIRPIYDFSNVTDGASFFAAFCSGPEYVVPSTTLPDPEVSPSASASSVTKPSSVASATPKPSPSLLGYPKPVAIDSSAQVSGYYINDTNYNDVAVLVLPAFGPIVSDPDSDVDPAVLGFVAAQKVLRGFFADAVNQNKQKLVIDLRGNGGGTIDLGFELFKQLFPTVEPYGAARYRAHEAFHYYSAAIADVAVNGTDKDGLITQNPADADTGIQSPFLWFNILNENLKPYKAYRDYYGPKTLNGDTFTSVRRYNFSNNLGGHTVPRSLTGYNEFRNITAQPFKPENIVILQDGLCGSTCAIFAELMREQGKVQTIAVGGRAVNQPMQGVAGSKGSQKLDLTTLYGAALSTVQIASALNGQAVANMLNSTSNAVGKILNAQQLFIRTTPPNPGLLLFGGINSLNNQRMNDSTETPLEFIYEAADCKLFYTRATFFLPQNMWKATADAKWGKGKCVPGSLGDKTAIGVIENKPGFGQVARANGTAAPGQSTGAAASMSVSSVGMGVGAIVAMVMVM